MLLVELKWGPVWREARRVRMEKEEQEEREKEKSAVEYQYRRSFGGWTSSDNGGE